jgi:hypothetical protein
MGDTKTIYDEVCRRHDGIAEFRAKLLTLLPIASGAGIFLLVAKDSIAATALPQLLPIGIFGVLVTLGLFVYELRGIQECNALIAAAKKLEEDLLSSGLLRFGAFNCKPTPVLRGTVGATGAALTIYPTVVGAWVYVAGVGAVETLHRNTNVIITALAAGGCALILGVVVDRKQRKLLSNSLATTESKESKAAE